MVKKRLIGAILVRDGIAVQSFGFRRWLPVGRPEIVAEYLNRWGIDEICLIDISARRQGRSIDPGLVRRVAAAAFVPLTAGGGLTTADQVHDLMGCGADKVLINGAAWHDPRLLLTLADLYGSQAVVAALDVRRVGPDTWQAVGPNGQTAAPLHHVTTLLEHGAGELLVNSMDQDGSGQGLDLDILRPIAALAPVPVIALGGVGTPRHVTDGLAVVPAVAVGNVFNHTEHSVALFKEAARRAGCDLRGGLSFSHAETPLDPHGRPLKRDEAFLDDLGPVRIERMVI